MSAQANLAGMFPPTEAMRWSWHLIWRGFIIFIFAFSPSLRQWDRVATSFEVDFSLSYVPPTEAMRWGCHLIWCGFIISIFVFSLPLRRWDGSLLIYAFVIVLLAIIFCRTIRITCSLPLRRVPSSFALEFVFLIIALISYATVLIYSLLYLLYSLYTLYTYLLYAYIICGQEVAMVVV